MHIYFSGIGGTGIGPLAMIAKQAGFRVSGSDKQDSNYIQALIKQGINDININQSGEELSSLHQNHHIDWLVYSSALIKENPNHPELETAKKLGIKITKRDEFLNYFIKNKNLKLIAVAGTHGKSTTTAMLVWAFKQLEIPVSYSVGAKLSFGAMGEFDSKSKYFVYEADEYDRNFLEFKPYISVISGIAYDHPDIYPTEESYRQAFSDFVAQSEKTVAFKVDAEKISVTEEVILVSNDRDSNIGLAGQVNRQDANLVIQTMMLISNNLHSADLIKIMSDFPGLSRRFEKIADNIYSDYAHTPEKIRGALQIAHEVAGSNVVVVYEGLHNTRQHFIKDQLANLFVGTKILYVVPSYRAREDENLEDLTPEKLCNLIQAPQERFPAKLDKNLKSHISDLVSQGFLVLCFSAGGGGSLDEWLRDQYKL